MRKMLKWIAALMALAMLLTLSAAFAEPAAEKAEPSKTPTATITMPITLTGTAPEQDPDKPEGYRIRLEALDKTSPMPEGAKDGVWESAEPGVFPEGELSAEITYNNVGIHKYYLTQVVDNAREDIMTYDARKYEIKVTVYRPDPKVDLYTTAIAYYMGEKDYDPHFNNTRKVGSLEISKEMARGVVIEEEDLSFEFKVELSQAATIPKGYEWPENVETTDNQHFTVVLAPGENAVLENLPAGAKYTVTETTDPDYYPIVSPVREDVIKADAKDSEGTAEPANVASYINTTAETVVLGAEKKLTGRTWMDGETYRFEISRVTEKAPLPANTTVSVTGKDSAFAFGPIKFVEPGEYTYAIKEIVPDTNPLNGVTYDDHTLNVTVTVTRNADGTLNPGTPVYDKPADETAEDPTVFTNRYHAEGTAIVNVTKVLTGRDYQEGDFWTFTLNRDNTDMPLPTNTEVTIRPDKKDETSFEFSFDAIPYTEADIGSTYIYEIKEEDLGDENIPGVTNAVHFYARVKVEDNKDGTLKTAVDYAADKEFKEPLRDSAVVTNTYNSVGEAVIEAAKKLLGRTLENGQFTFELTTKDLDVKPVQASNDADGKVDFGKISYNQDSMVEDGKNVLSREITYTIKEIVPEKLDERHIDENYYQYDIEPQTVKVQLVDDGFGKITSKVIYEDEKVPEFVNAYETIELKKELTRVVRNGQDIAVTKGMAVQAGDVLTYTITVNNIGGVPILKDTEFQDTFTRTLKNDTTEVSYPTVKLEKELAVGESVPLTYQYTVAPDDKILNNVVTSEIPGDNPPPVENPIEAMKLQKTLTTITRGGAAVADTSKAQAGDIITYTVTVTNDGEVEIPEGFKVTDTMTKTLKDNTKVDVVKTLETTKALKYGEQESFTYTYEMEPNVKAVTNAATSDGPGDNPPPVVVPVESLQTVKKATSIQRGEETIADPEKAQAGDVITYTITVTNNGDVDLAAGRKVTDTLTRTLKNGTTATETQTWTTKALAVGESQEFNYTYTVRNEDKSLNNAAVADLPGDNPPPVVTPIESVNTVKTVTAIARNGAVVTDLTKAQAGDVITYTIKVTNDGEVPIPAGLKITDTLTRTLKNGTTATETAELTTKTALAVGASENLTWTYTVQPNDKSLSNVAVSELPGDNPPPVVTPIESVNTVKTVTAITRNGAAVADLTKAQAGDVITYTIRVTNDGDTPIAAGLKITDTLTRTLKDNTTATETAELTTKTALAVGASENLTWTYTVQPNDKSLRNVAMSELPGDNPPPVVTPIESVNTVKTVTAITRNGAAVTDLTKAQGGDVITYTIRVTNDGNVAIPAGLKITDTLTRTLKDNTTATKTAELATTTELAVGASENLTWTYTVQPNDKSLRNVAMSELPGDNPPPVVTPIESVKTEKVLTTITRNGAALADLTKAQAGDVITYTVRVTNDGDVAFPDGVTITDTMTRTLKNNTTATVVTELKTAALAAGASEDLTYTYTVAENDKSLSNAATSGLPGDNPPPVVTPIESVVLEKTLTTITRGGAAVTGHETAQAGDVITYTITLTNDGDVTIPAEQTITDTLTRLLTDNTTATVVTELKTTKALASGESEALTYTYTVAANDKRLTNAATSDLPGDNPPPVVTPITSMTVIKTSTSTPANGTAYTLGETITYSILVYNNGDTDITDLTVVDELTGDNWEVGTLAAGMSRAFTAEHAVTEADILAGRVLNVVTATGKDPNGDEIKKEDDEEDPTEDPNGHLTVVKTTTSTPANGTAYILGETITYEITVTNDGNLTVTDIVLTDERTGLTAEVGTLKPGETSAVFQTSTTVTAADVAANTAVNDATATGKTPDPEDPDNPESPNKPDVPVTPGHTEDPVIETVDLTVQKVWVETTTPARPANLIVTLTGNGTSQYVTLNETNSWTATVTGLPRYTAAGAEITYTWTEPTIAGYEQTNYVTTGNTTVITNTQTQVEAETEYTLTVRYRFLNGRQAAPDVTEQHVAGDPYNVVSPTIRGYTTTTLRVTGVMPESDLTRTVVYIPGNNTIVIDDFETPLGLGDVFINVGDCLE